MAPAASFEKAVKIRLIEMDKSQTWLIEQVKNRTGLYFDSSYLWKVLNGVLKTPAILQAVREILDLPDTPDDTPNEDP